MRNINLAILMELAPVAQIKTVTAIFRNDLQAHDAEGRRDSGATLHLVRR